MRTVTVTKARFILALLALVVGVLGAGALLLRLGFDALDGWGQRTYTLAEPREIELTPGMPLSALSKMLAEEGVIEKKLLFEHWVKYFHDYSRFQAGRYRFEGEVSPFMIAKRFANGEIYVPILLRITVPEGFTMHQVAALLVERGIGEREEVQRLLEDPAFLEELKVPSTTLEGYLFPATYPFSAPPTAREALARMVRTFWKRLPDSYAAMAEAREITVNDAVTIASLIERETSLGDERPIIAEVIWRRLDRKVALAIDASIAYGIKDFDGDLTFKHLRDASNPYNLRKHRGLPPTPICSPSTASLEAVFQPTDHGYFYYVVDSENPSRHHFSKTLREHNRHVRALVRRGR